MNVFASKPFYISLFVSSIFCAQIVGNEISSTQNPASLPTNTATKTTSNTSNDVGKLELAGSDSFGYDIANKIRQSKSSFNFGIGMNVIKTEKFEFNASVLLGYSHFFNKNFGLRGYGLFDNFSNGFYGGVGADIVWDFLQTEAFGMGVILGSSIGYAKNYDNTLGADEFLTQFHGGISLIFDSGKSRLEGIVRIPYKQFHLLNQFNNSGITYIFMYSYTF